MASSSPSAQINPTELYQEINNTLGFFLDYNYYNYYGLNFLRFYAKKALKLFGIYDGNSRFHDLRLAALESI